MFQSVFATQPAFLGRLAGDTRQTAKTEERLEEQLPAVFQALQENSRQAAQLLARLQQEVTDRNQTIQNIETKLHELRQERTMLELTSEQREAIKGLIRRPQSLGEMLTSLDFWVGQVAVNTGFFVLGLIASWIDRWRISSGP
jgi:ABC-type transporter Mla subunit MlaD